MLPSVADDVELRLVAHSRQLAADHGAMTTHDPWLDWHVRFREALESYKKRHNYADADVAEKAGYSRQSVNHWANGVRTPQLDSFMSICKTIDADPAQVLFGEIPTPTDALSKRIANLSPEGRQAVEIAIEGAEARDARNARPKASNGS